MITAGQPVAVYETVLQTHAAVNAAIVPYVAFAVGAPPGDAFDVEQVYRLHVAGTEQGRPANGIPGIFPNFLHAHIRLSVTSHQGNQPIV